VCVCVRSDVIHVFLCVCVVTHLRWIFGYTRARDQVLNRPVWMSLNYALVVMHATTGLDCVCVCVCLCLCLGVIVYIYVL